MMNNSNNTGGIIFVSDWDAYFGDKEIHPDKIFNDFKREAVRKEILKDSDYETAEQKENKKKLAEKFKFQDIRDNILNSNLPIGIEEITSIMVAKNEEELNTILENMGHRLTDEAREQSELGKGLSTRHKADDYKYSVTIDGKLPDMTLGVKETENKIDYSEINLDILDIMAERFTANKEKYPKGNMKKYIDKENLEWALFRHIKKMISPIENDPETYEEHLAAVLCNASMILDQLKLTK